MRIWSYVGATYETRSFSGVARFDHEIRKVFPEIRSVTELPNDLDPSEDLVITDNHLSTKVSPGIKTIVVHHGCAKTHWDRDVSWRNPTTEALIVGQRDMFRIPNRWFVAPSRWCRDEFVRHYGLPDNYAEIIPHWVEPFGPAPRRTGRVTPIVLGDWRDANKGAQVVEQLRRKLPAVQFCQLSCAPGWQRPIYLNADAYLCLSLSEGAPYAVADAEGGGLPIVSTDVGWVHEFPGIQTFEWRRRGDLDIIAYWIQTALVRGRMDRRFYDTYTFDVWASKWRNLIGRVGECGKRPSARALQTAPPDRVLFGVAGGIGNSIFCLPALAAIHKMGIKVMLYTETDYPSRELWERCSYVDKVISPPAEPPPAPVTISGPWCPPRIPPDRRIRRYSWQSEPDYREPEWSLVMNAARDLGWMGEDPSLKGWCRGSERKIEFDVGIIPGCKPNTTWERKKYPGFGKVSEILRECDLKVAVLGTNDDKDPTIVGKDLCGAYTLAELPDAILKCGVIVGIDSGPTHLAASLSVPTIVIYTATSETKGQPVGDSWAQIVRRIPCHPCQSTPQWHACSDWQCRSIDPRLVADVARVALSKGIHGLRLWDVPIGDTFVLLPRPKMPRTEGIEDRNPAGRDPLLSGGPRS